MTFPKVGITLGDPGGIGPEVVIKAFSGKYRLPLAHYILYGSSSILRTEKKLLGISFELDESQGEKKPKKRILSLREVGPPLEELGKGAPSARNGRVSFSYFEAAVEEARQGLIQAIVTAPISKKSWGMANIPWRGHTEYLSHFFPGAIMAFWSKRIKVALFSHHLPLQEAIEKVSKKNLLSFLLTLHQSLQRIQAGNYEYLVSGLNPHAGEGGLLGVEETEEIIPAIVEAGRKGMRISGPFPPDVVFRQALGRQRTIVIALFHDQGLIPFKLESFDRGVNVSLGLSFIRTSPDHGTAFDIAGKNMASPWSLIEALKLAVRMA